MKANRNISPLRNTTEKAENSNPGIFSPNMLRSYKGCEHYTDLEAKEIIKFLEKLSAICYSMMCNTNSIYIDNQQVVYLNPLQVIKLQAA